MAPQTTQRALKAAKLVKCKELVRRGFSIREAAEKVGLPIDGTRKRAEQEGWIAEGADWKQLSTLDLPTDREVHNRRVYDLVRIGLDRLEVDTKLEVLKFAQALDTLDKVGRRLLGLDTQSTNAPAVFLATQTILNA